MKGKEPELRSFVTRFFAELSKQVELGQAANDSDYLNFQSSVNANVRSGVRSRHEILLRKLFAMSPSLAGVFDPSVIAEAGIAGRIKGLADSISALVTQVNEKHSAAQGEDLFKPTNKTISAQNRLRQQVGSLADYKSVVDDLYFLFWEGPGSKLQTAWPPSFLDIRDLRTSIRHDVDHGETGKVKGKRKKAGEVFARYGGMGTPETMDPMLLAVVQANLLSAVEGDLKGILRAI